MFQHRIQGVFFTGYTGKELQSLAVKKIDNPETFDQLLHPNANGLYDHALGPSDKSDRCDTCSLSSVKCPGHFGYIQLPLPVYHPLFFKLLVQVLKGSCFTCHRFIPKMSNLRLFTRQCDLLDHGFLTEASVLSERYGSFTIKASENSATDVNLQQVICDQIDEYYHSVVNSSTAAKTKSTKNLVKCRQEILKDFIKVQLLKKIKQCPHCDAVKRNVRSEYNTRLYFSSASQKAVQKAVTNKLIDELKKNVKKEAKQEVEEEEENAPEGDLLEDEEEEEEDEEIEEEDRKVKMKQEATNRKKSEEKLKKKLSGEEYITPNEVKKHILELWSTEHKVLKSLFGSFNCPTRNKKVATPEIFFLDIISVPPSRFRPMLHMGDKAFENPQTANLNKILWKCKLIEELLNRLNEPVPEGEVYVPVVLASTQAFQKKNQAATIPGASHKEQLKNAWEGLQVDVNTLMDNTLDKLNQTPVPGIRQLLEKKEGLFRKNMMGKRVNFACRSVISPDPYINMDEIGVPLVFASKLTYAQPVTSWNVEQLKRMVINGPNKWPGAVMIESEDGRKTMLSENEDERRSVAKKLLSTTQKNRFDNATVNCEKKVHRHLINGDVMLLNRQPTLHRPSIMAHKAKVLPGERTLRMHYANCKSYNADFDGDEMNAHFPQNELGRSEAYNLVSTNANYLSPKDGKPLAGLIQDHVVSGVWMTSRDKFFTREEYQQLIFNALIDSPGRITTLPPCILKPIPMWSGKQIFSSVLLNIIPKGKHPLNMKGGKAKVCDNNWPTGSNKRVHENYSNDPYLIESQVIIREGQLMTGVLDKTQYGSTQFGLVHCVYELYGGEVSGLLLSVLARLFTAYLQHTGFTLGIHDILVLPSAETRRRKHLTEGRQCGDESAMEALNVAEKAKLKESMEKAQYTNAGAELAQLDLSMKQRTDKITNKINTECIKGLVKKFPDNSLQLMVQSGAKGSTVNCMQISCLLGQIELEGRRPPLSLSGRSLPSFLPHDTSPRAGGFVDGRFLTGIRPQEYFFHCMAGREGLIDTAVKTSRSGYLQRCLIKHLEALYVHYDMSVRDGDGSVVQFLYGDDGIDVLQNLFLKIDQYKTIVQNYKSYKQLLKPAQLSQCVEMKKAVKAQRKLDRWRKRHGEPFTNLYNHQRKSPFNLFEDENKRKMAKKYSSMEANKFGRKEVDEKLIEKWKKRDGPNKQEYLSRCPPCPDPVLSRYNAQCYFGAVSERFAQDVDRFVKLNPENTLVDEENEEKGKISSDTFKPLMLMKYLKSTVHPGEAVGLLASQSIGEPSTQMTLNTFHFAGQSDMNVTLGIPRLREILMTASENIKTPQMDILVRSGKEEEAKSIAKRLNRVTLIQVLEQLSVYESLARTSDKTLCRQFRVHLQLLPQSLYEENFVVTPQSIMRYIESVFIKRVCQATTKIIRTKDKERLIDTKAARNEYRMQSNNRDNEENEAAADEEEEEDFSDEENADGDATNMKERNRQKQFSSYDDPEERNAEIDEDNNEEESIVKKEPLGEDEYTTVEVSEPMIAAIKQELNGSELRINNVLKRDRHVTNYKVCEKNSWCEFTLQFPLSGSKLMLTNVVEKLAEKSVVYEAAGITRSMVSESKAPTERGRCRLKTEGVSMQELWKYPEALDLKTLYSNNIHSVAKTYGIEAARSVLIKEVQDVFKVYGIQIDVRHLSLVGDYMTFEGVYKPFNRIGIETNSFPFQKMSFETSTSFLRTATAFGEPDDLGSPSSRIVVGRVIGTGTGLMELLPKIS